MKLEDFCNWDKLQDCDIGIWFELLKLGDFHFLQKDLSAFRISAGALTSTAKMEYPKQYTRVFTYIYNNHNFNISYPLLLWSKFMCYLLHFARILFVKYFTKD